MVYIINNYDGSQLVGINDQTANNTATSLRLPGRDYKPYGEVIVENLIWMLQHFSGVTPPLRAVEGQVWYNKTTQDIQVYNGVEWVNTGKNPTGDIFPAGAQPGQIFYHTTKKQLFVKDTTTDWKLVAPIGATDNTDPVPGAAINYTDQRVVTVTDTLSANHKVIQITVKGAAAGVTVGVWSADPEFTLASALPAFDQLVIKPGLNLNSTHVLNGVATNATNAVTATPGNSSTLIANTQFVTNALLGKADLAGDATQTFLVANATLSNQAVNLAQVLALQPATPTGVIAEFAGAVAPTGWLLCDGAAVSRSTYLNLYNVIGITYGAGDTTTTFNLPDRRGRFGLGANGSFPLATSGGAFTSGSYTLLLTDIPSHTHTAEDASLTGTFGPFRQPLNDPNASGSGVFSRGNVFGSGDAFDGTRDAVEINMNATHTHTINAVGGGGGHSHSVNPPYLSVNYIIKT